MLHFETATGIFRFYDEGKSFQNRDPYRAVIHAMFLSSTVILGAALGKSELRRADMRDLVSFLYDFGVKYLYAGRSEGRCLPKAVMETEGPYRGMWKIDIAAVNGEGDD